MTEREKLLKIREALVADVYQQLIHDEWRNPVAVTTSLENLGKLCRILEYFDDPDCQW